MTTPAALAITACMFVMLAWAFWKMPSWNETPVSRPGDE